MSNKKMFVYDGQEVVLTGRQAKRELPQKPGRRSARRISVVVEIKPADNENGSWTRWVKMTDLYEIIDMPVTADPAANETLDVPDGYRSPPFIPTPPWDEPDVCGSPKPFPFLDNDHKKGGPYDHLSDQNKKGGPYPISETEQLTDFDQDE